MPGPVPSPHVLLVTQLSPQLEGALGKGHEETLEALPKNVLLSKESMDAILYFLGALTGKWGVRSSFIHLFSSKNESLNEFLNE